MVVTNEKVRYSGREVSPRHPPLRVRQDAGRAELRLHGDFVKSRVVTNVRYMLARLPDDTVREMKAGRSRRVRSLGKIGMYLCSAFDPS